MLNQAYQPCWRTIANKSALLTILLREARFFKFTDLRSVFTNLLVELKVQYYANSTNREAGDLLAKKYIMMLQDIKLHCSHKVSLIKKMRHQGLDQDAIERVNDLVALSQANSGRAASVPDDVDALLRQTAFVFSAC